MMTERSASRIPGWGAWLKGQAQARGFTQNEFASALGVSKSTVSRWMTGYQPSGIFVDRIADVLVLDYDVVATKAGYRPDIFDIDPSSREAEVLGLVHRIDWERPGEGVEMVVDMLQVLANRLPKRMEREGGT